MSLIRGCQCLFGLHTRTKTNRAGYDLRELDKGANKQLKLDRVAVHISDTCRTSAFRLCGTTESLLPFTLHHWLSQGRVLVSQGEPCCKGSSWRKRAQFNTLITIVGILITVG